MDPRRNNGNFRVQTGKQTLLTCAMSFFAARTSTIAIVRLEQETMSVRYEGEPRSYTQVCWQWSYPVGGLTAFYCAE
jgi:hypothetical protein